MLALLDLLVTQSGGFVPAILQASKNEGVVQGQAVDFDRLPEADEGKEEFAAELQRAMRAKRLVWVLGAAVLDGKINLKMSEQKNEDKKLSLTFSNLKVCRFGLLALNFSDPLG